MRWKTETWRFGATYAGSMRLDTGECLLGVDWELRGRRWWCRWWIWPVFDPCYGLVDSIDAGQRAASAAALERGMITAHELAKAAR